MTDDLLSAIRDLPKVSSYLHVPAQSGADSVLERMKRGYTVGEYRDMMQRIRSTLPDGAVSSDFIVGFCGETEEEFEKTVELVKECDSRTASSSSTVNAPVQRVPSGWRTTFRWRWRTAAITNCSIFRIRSAGGSSGIHRTRSWSARRRTQQERAEAGHRRGFLEVGRSHPVRSNRGLRREPPPSRPP